MAFSRSKSRVWFVFLSDNTQHSLRMYTLLDAHAHAHTALCLYVCVCVCVLKRLFFLIHSGHFNIANVRASSGYVAICLFLNDKLMRKERKKKYDSRERQKCKHLTDSLKYIGDARYLHISYYLDQVRFERVLIRDTAKTFWIKRRGEINSKEYWPKAVKTEKKTRHERTSFA